MSSTNNSTTSSTDPTRDRSTAVAAGSATAAGTRSRGRGRRPAGESVTGGGAGTELVHSVAVTVGVWGPPHTAVRTSSGGGPGDAAFVAVTAGKVLVYVYDVDGLWSHAQAWQQAARLNAAVRLPELRPSRQEQQRQAPGNAVGVVCQVRGEQRVSVVAAPDAPAGRMLTVTVGAVSVQVHTTTALRAYLDVWTRALRAQHVVQD